MGKNSHDMHTLTHTAVETGACFPTVVHPLIVVIVYADLI